MYRQQVRRRRAVLAALVALSLILLTVYFGESAGGGLHTLQRGVLSVLSPIQEGASRALKPARDLTNWVGDTLSAKGKLEETEQERDQLRRELLRAQVALRENVELRGLVGLDRQADLDAYRPVTGRVIGRSPTVWYSTITIDKGSSSGVRVDQPVVGGDGLVGKVTAVTAGAAVVTLITDHTSGVSAKIVSPSLQRTGSRGIVQARAGAPDDLLLEFVRRDAPLREGDRVVTAGTMSERYTSLFPPDIPIGEITEVDDQELRLYQRAHIEPFADLPRLDFVQVLTEPTGDGVRAQAP